MPAGQGHPGIARAAMVLIEKEFAARGLGGLQSKQARALTCFPLWWLRCCIDGLQCRNGCWTRPANAALAPERAWRNASASLSGCVCRVSARKRLSWGSAFAALDPAVGVCEAWARHCACLPTSCPAGTSAHLLFLPLDAQRALRSWDKELLSALSAHRHSASLTRTHCRVLIT